MMNTTQTEWTTEGRKTFDRMTRRLTAFGSYTELDEACATGYAPTLSQDDSEAAILGTMLEMEGRRVFWRRTSVHAR